MTPCAPCLRGEDSFISPYNRSIMFHPIDDLRIKWTKVVLPPVFLEEEMPTTETASATVHQARHEICEILGGSDRRLLVVCRAVFDSRHRRGA